MGVVQVHRRGERCEQDRRPGEVDTEGEQPVRGCLAALGRDDEPAVGAQHGRAQRPQVDRGGERGHGHAGETTGSLGLVRGDVVPAVPEVEPDLEGGGVAVEHQPDRGGDLGAGRPEPEEQHTAEDAEQPVDRGHRVVDEHQRVAEEAAGRHPEQRLAVLLEQRLIRSPGPAQLLGEEVRPGGGPLAHGQHVGGVDGAPVVSGARVAAAVDLEAGGHVLGDRVVQAPDLPQRGDAHDVVGADEHRGAVAVARALDQGVEEELLRLGGLGDGRVVVPVDLRSDDEGDVRVAEVAHHPLQEIGHGHVVGVDGGEEVVVAAVQGDPGVVVAVLRLRLVDALVTVPLGDPAPREVVDAQLGAEHPGPGVVALVEQPDVQRAGVLQAYGALEGGADHGERFLAGDVRGQEGDLGAGLGRHGDRVPRDERGVRDGDHVDQHEQLDQGDRHQHHGVGDDQPALPVLPLGPVRGPDQVQQEDPGEHRGEGHQQDGSYSVLLRREQALVPHPVPRRFRLRERTRRL